MSDESSSYKIGELLCSIGAITTGDLTEAIQIAKRLGVPIGRVLVMSGCVTEEKLQAALEAQSMIRDTIIDPDTAIRALALVFKNNKSLSDALDELNWTPRKDKDSNKLGDLLVDSHIVTRDQLNKALEASFQSGMPLGGTLVLQGVLSAQLLPTVLHVQELVRENKITRVEAIERMQQALMYWAQANQSKQEELFDGAQTSITKRNTSSGSKSGAMKKPVVAQSGNPAQTGGFLKPSATGGFPKPSATGGFKKAQVAEAQGAGVNAPQPAGANPQVAQVEVGSQGWSAPQTTAANKVDPESTQPITAAEVQGLLSQQFVKPGLARSALGQAAAAQSAAHAAQTVHSHCTGPFEVPANQGWLPSAVEPAPAKSAPKPAADTVVNVVQLLKLSGVASPQEIQDAVDRALSDNYSSAKLLLAVGVVDKKMLEVVVKCQSLIAKGVLKVDQAIYAVNGVRYRAVSLEEALAELGIPGYPKA